jgi:type 1 glutamine amidotransferase
VRPVHVSAFEGVGTFTVRDEFYLQDVASDVTVRMVGIHDNTDHPMAWTREEGRGRVAHIAPGHDEGTWKLPAYRNLVVAAVAWLLTPSSAAAS